MQSPTFQMSHYKILKQFIFHLQYLEALPGGHDIRVEGDKGDACRRLVCSHFLFVTFLPIL